MSRIKIIISGKVHGVFFRDSTKKKADCLGIKGYVKNLNNGDVLVVAEGKNLDEFVQFCKKGPEAAKVNKIKVTPHKEEEEFFGSFEIRY
jgi:acylphosphatase